MMDPSFQEFADVFTQPKKIPPSPSIDLTLDLIPGVSILEALSYHITLRESIEMEYPIGQLFNLGHISPSASPCADKRVRERRASDNLCSAKGKILRSREERSRYGQLDP